MGNAQANAKARADEIQGSNAGSSEQGAAPPQQHTPASQELNNAIQSVDRLRTLEKDHDIKLNEKEKLQKSIKELEKYGRELLLKQQESHNHELQSLDAANKRNYDEEMVSEVY